MENFNAKTQGRRDAKPLPFFTLCVSASSYPLGSQQPQFFARGEFLGHFRLGGRVLRFLAHHAGQSFYEQEIVERIDVSRSAVNLATRALHQAGLLRRERRGRMNFYAADDRHPFVRQSPGHDRPIGTSAAGTAATGPSRRSLRQLCRGHGHSGQ